MKKYRYRKYQKLYKIHSYNKKKNKEFNITAEKITVTIPYDLKEKLVNIKDEL